MPAHDVVVRFEQVGKRYQIDHLVPPRGAHADLLPRLWSRLARALRKRPAGTREEIWALREVSFEVHRGEVFAIVGANGAGKSTLLKLLTRVTPPTSGRIATRGRIASLLEVGTGFHPELTGRENVFLNAAILGLSRAEIRQRFDRIVAFSGVERFIDTPVKRYSSGMYVRLAFSIAAHVEHEIMVVDEVLAVGDAAFRERCLALIASLVRDEGRTVLFVSHDLSQVRRLAARALLLEAGAVTAVGPTPAVLARYLAGALAPVLDAVGVGAAGSPTSPEALAVRLEDGAGRSLDAVTSGAPVELVLDLGVVPARARAELAIDDPRGHRLWTGATWLAEGPAPLRCTIGALPLRPGTYPVTLALEVDGHRLIEHGAGALRIVAASAADPEPEADAGPLALDARWGRG